MNIIVAIGIVFQSKPTFYLTVIAAFFLENKSELISKIQHQFDWRITPSIHIVLVLSFFPIKQCTILNCLFFY